MKKEILVCTNTIDNWKWLRKHFREVDLSFVETNESLERKLLGEQAINEIVRLIILEEDFARKNVHENVIQGALSEINLIHSLNRDVKIIFIAKRTNCVMEAAIRRKDVFSYLVSPVNQEVLISLIQKAIEHDTKYYLKISKHTTAAAE